GPRLIPSRKIVRALDPRVVAAQGPDPATETGRRPLLTLLDHGERVAAKKVPVREIGRRFGYAPADRPSERWCLAGPDALGGMPQCRAVRSRETAVASADLWLGKPLVELKV